MLAGAHLGVGELCSFPLSKMGGGNTYPPPPIDICLYCKNTQDKVNKFNPKKVSYIGARWCYSATKKFFACGAIKQIMTAPLSKWPNPPLLAGSSNFCHLGNSNLCGSVFVKEGPLGFLDTYRPPGRGQNSQGGCRNNRPSRVQK